MLKADGWMKLIEAYDLVDDDFPLSQAVLCFVWARMATVDEVRDYGRFESLTFVDFLEALALVAELKHLPTASDLADAGLNMLQWAQAKATGAPAPPHDLHGGAIFYSALSLQRNDHRAHADTPNDPVHTFAYS